MELGFFSRSSSSFFWRLSTKTAKQLARRGQSNGRDGLVAGWPKTNRREKQEWRHCRARKQARLGNATPRKGFPFYSSTERNGHPNRLR
jgi:hypothetical protein